MSYRYVLTNAYSAKYVPIQRLILESNQVHTPKKSRVRASSQGNNNLQFCNSCCLILRGNVPEVPKVYTIISAPMRVSQTYQFLFLSVLAVEKFGTELPEKFKSENLQTLAETGSYLVSKNILNLITSVVYILYKRAFC